MLTLPSFRSSNDHRQIDTTVFRGLNLTENTTEGELRDSLGITADKAPTLSTMKGRSVRAAYPSDSESPAAISDIFAWDKLAVICDGKFYYDDTVRGDITDGLKQFAVVNTKLCIFPDKVYLDLTDPTKRLQSLQASLTARAGSASFSGKTLTIDGAAPGTAHTPVTISMTHDGLKWLRVYDSLEWYNGTWIKGEMTEKLVTELAEGDLTIPDASGDLITTTVKGDYTDCAAENTSGTAARITSTSSATTSYVWEKWNVSSYSYQYYMQSGDTLTYEGAMGSYVGYTGYYFNSSTGRYEGRGSSVTIVPADGASATTYVPGGSSLMTYVCTGTIVRIYQRNSSGPYWDTYYSKGSTRYDDVYAASSGAYPSNNQQGGYWYVSKGASPTDADVTIGYDTLANSQMNGRFSTYFRVGNLVQISGCTETLDGNNTPEGEYIKISAVDDYSLTFDMPENFTSGTEAGAVTVTRPVPDLDYICESDNRLWGVNSETRTIYASALGDPTDFWSLGLLSTDAFQAAVGTDGDWTGICKAGGGVCCWKEHTLHKVLGSYPANYQINTYSVPGVQAGSARSMQNINETLYYKGVDGIYAYGGGTPSLVSPGFNGVQFDYAVGGSGNGKYYISMLRRDTESYGMYELDLDTGFWLKTDNTKCEAYATLDNIVYAAIGRSVYALQTAENSDGVSWLAEFVPFTETALSRKKYKRLLLRIDMDAGSELRIETKLDRDRWRIAYEKRAAHEVTLRVPLTMGRCDRFALRISGVGGVVIYALEREFVFGSDI
jgi:hypothetical protein